MEHPRRRRNDGITVEVIFFCFPVAQDMMVWSHTDENRAIQDVMEQINELHNFWADSQKDFLGKFISFCFTEVNF